MKTELLIEMLESDLPHGSGIDGTWNIEDKGSYIKAVNFFHCMDEHGYYDGYADFSLTIPKKCLTDFKMHFHGPTSQYLNRKYMLRDYLEETFHYALSLIVQKSLA